MIGTGAQAALHRGLRGGSAVSGGPPPLLLAPAWVARSGGRMVPLGNAAGPLTFVTFTGAAAAVLEGDP